MTSQEMIGLCDEQISIAGESANIMLILPGKWGKTNRRKLFKCKEAPIGTIISDKENGTIMVMFKAIEVKKFLI